MLLSINILFQLLIVFIVLYFFGSLFGKKGSLIFACYTLFFCLCEVVCSFFIKVKFGSDLFFIIDFGNWMSALYIDISWSFLYDNVSLLMLLVVITVSSCVHFYSVYYMESDSNIIKFFSYLSLFTFFMCLLVLSSNFIVLFLGWEGVGLCSFLLISFWNTRVQANKSALKAMLINRVGDFFLLVAIVLMIINFKSVDYMTVFSLAHIYSLKILFIFYETVVSVVDVVSIFILLGAVTKSAQLGFHGWLPDAMEGPTPVSALIHAATMVTAGVFLIVRTSFLFEFSIISLTILIYLGSLTAVLFGIVGFFQYDIKKIIAFSTCSQLGYMILACGLSGYNFAFFHLFTHAGFKALLFLSAGTFIHMMGNEQDIRKMGGAFNVSYLNCVCFIIGSITLFGFPFLSGYFSKEPIIQLAFLYKENPIVFLFIELSTALTILYSFKIFYYLFFKKNFNNRKFSQNTDFNFFNFGPLLVLSVVSIFSGYLFKDMFIGLGNNFFFGSIFSMSSDVLEVEFIFFFLKIIPVFLIVIVGYLFYEFYVVQFKVNKHLYFYNYSCFLFFNRVMFIDSFINYLFGFIFNSTAYTIFFIFDKGFLEVFGPLGLKVNLVKLNNFLDTLFINSFSKMIIVTLYILAFTVVSAFIIIMV